MMCELQDFRPKTKQAEQEFLSFYWGKKGALNAIHKKYNFQIHHLYFATPDVPPGAESQTSFAHMIDRPEEIRVHHFSADQKPSMILVNDMASIEGWMQIEDHLREHARYMMEMHGHKNPSLHSQPEWKGKIEQFLRGAYLEWFDAWKRTYVNVVNYVLETAYNKMVCTRTDDGDHVRCPCCESSGTPRSWKRILTSFEITFSSIEMCWPRTSRFLSNTR